MGKIKKKFHKDALALEAKSVLGFMVRTTKVYWQIITHIKHTSLNGKEKEVKLTLQCPTEIRVSKKDNQVLLFYRKFNDIYLCVVVRQKVTGDGFIITAYYTRKIKEGERKWKK